MLYGASRLPDAFMHLSLSFALHAELRVVSAAYASSLTFLDKAYAGKIWIKNEEYKCVLFVFAKYCD